MRRILENITGHRAIQKTRGRLEPKESTRVGEQKKKIQDANSAFVLGMNEC